MTDKAAPEVTTTQTAPYPYPLADLISRTTYRPGWRIALMDMDRGQGSAGLTLVVTALVADTRDGAMMRVNHLFPVPPAAYNERSWRNWLFEQLLAVESHEAAEFFKVDGEGPFAPLHAPGNDPYMRVEATWEEAHTDFRGHTTERPRDEAMSKVLGHDVHITQRVVDEPVITSKGGTYPPTFEPLVDPLKSRPKGWGE